MNEKTVAAVALSNRDFPSFAARLQEAAHWVDSAAAQGADLVVLPELLNRYKGDGVQNGSAYGEMALANWQADCAILIETAIRRRVAVALPLLIREGGKFANVFFLVDRDGSVRGRYQKSRLTPGELKAGVQPGGVFTPIVWEGLKIGGAICFDCYYPEVFQRQADLGADLFLVPSLTPAEGHLNYYALQHSAPVVLAYPAWSRIIDVNGADLAAGGYRNETLRFGFGSPVVMATLNFDRAVFFAALNQDKMNDVQKKYGAKVRIRFDQPNVLFVVESRDPDLSMKDVIREFGLVTKKDYFNDPVVSVR
jgi:predicted amidohydrolase